MAAAFAIVALCVHTMAMFWWVAALVACFLAAVLLAWRQHPGPAAHGEPSDGADKPELRPVFASQADTSAAPSILR